MAKKTDMDISKTTENKPKKIIIIGGGVAGLSAGIFGQRAGFDTVIYEKNTVAGGSCSGWYRQGYAIDNCLHWLTGTKEGTAAYQLWNELGLLDENTELFRRACFWASEYEGKTVTLWPDAEKTRAEMLELSPEDATEINAFIDLVKLGTEVIAAGVKPKDLAHTINTHESVLSDRQFFRYSMRYFGLNNVAWAAKFKSPLIRSLILDFCPKEYESYWLVIAYSFYVSGNADVIKGGSIRMAQILTDNYLAAGGTLELGRNVKQVVIDRRKHSIIEEMRGSIHEGLENGVSIKTARKVTAELASDVKDDIVEKVIKRASGIVLDTGEKIDADYVICACDINYTFKHLLNKKYAPITLKRIYDDKKTYPLYSACQVAFAVDGLFEEIPDSLSFACRPIEAAYEVFERIGVKNYRAYGDYIAPEGKTVIQVSLNQYKKDFQYWKKLYKNDHEGYVRAKNNIAAALENAICDRFPQYEGRLTLLDVWTPYSYARRSNDTQGAFMRYITTATSMNAMIPEEIIGLDNVFLAGHWLKYPGGVPTAALTGKNAIGHIVAKEKRD